MTNLLGLIGRQRAGKNLTAEILRRLYPGREVVQFAFADKMREALYAMDPAIRSGAGSLLLSQVVDLYGWDYVKEQYPEVRRLLQRFGTEVGRNFFGQDFWVNLIWPEITRAMDRKALVVITDARFYNEVQRITHVGGGVVWRIERRDLPPEDLSLPKYQHASEKEWRSWVPNSVIANDKNRPGWFAQEIANAAMYYFGTDSGVLVGDMPLDSYSARIIEYAAVQAQSQATPIAA